MWVIGGVWTPSKCGSSDLPLRDEAAAPFFLPCSMMRCGGGGGARQWFSPPSSVEAVALLQATSLVGSSNRDGVWVVRPQQRTPTGEVGSAVSVGDSPSVLRRCTAEQSTRRWRKSSVEVSGSEQASISFSASSCSSFRRCKAAGSMAETPFPFGQR